MVVRVENGIKTYHFHKRTATKVVFWLLFTCCVASIVAFSIMFLCDAISDTWVFLEKFGGALFAMLFLLFIPVMFEKVCKLYVPNAINILLYTIPVLNLVVGHSWGIFYLGFGFDTLMHAYNGVIFVFLGISVVLILNHMPLKNRNTSMKLIMFFAFCFSMFIEYMWEILEYAIDTIAPSANMQEWEGSLIGVINGQYIHNNYRGNAIQDTVMDMLFHAATSFLTCVICYFYARHKEFGVYKISILPQKTVGYLKELSGTGLEIGSSLSESGKQ